jgi:glycosyltransferase involved in cell wall biosynthesis
MSKLISCIIPTHNQAQYLPQCLESILEQTYKNFEIIVVNDCSTDNTRDILDDYINKYSNIKVVHSYINLKLPKALNVGLERCYGDYITWMSSDSFYYKDAFRVMIEALEKNKEFGLVSTDFNIYGDSYKEIKYNKKIYTFEDMKQGNFVGCCFMFRKECFEEVGYFDPEMIGVEDWDFWTRISQKWPLLKINGIYAYWRDHKSNMSNTIMKDIGFQQETKLKDKYRDMKAFY